MSPLVRKLLLYGLFFAVLFLVFAGIDWHRDHERRVQVAAAFEQVRLAAQKDLPRKSPSQAFADEARRSGNAALQAEQSPRRRLEMAATSVLSYSIANTRIRPAVCSALGIDIQPFADAFAHENAAEIDKARTLLAGGLYSEERIYEYAGEHLRDEVERETQDYAAERGLTPKAACAEFARNAGEFASAMRVAKAMSEKYEVLLGTQ